MESKDLAWTSARAMLQDDSYEHLIKSTLLQIYSIELHGINLLNHYNMK